MTARGGGRLHSKGRPLLSAGLTRLGLILLLLAIWELAGRASDPLFVAPPSATVVSLWSLFFEKGVMDAIAQAAWELFSAFLIASIFGAVIGLIVGRNRFANTALYPIILLLYSLPQAPLLPLFVLIFGIGPASKIAFGVTHGVFPMIVTVAAGVQRLDTSLLKAARSMGARGHQVLWSIVLPSTTPSFFTGLRLAMSGVLLGVLLAELFVSQAGIGFYTRRFTDTFEPANLFALIAMLAAIAVTLNEICRFGEKWFSRWRA